MAVKGTADKKLHRNIAACLLSDGYGGALQHIGICRIPGNFTAYQYLPDTQESHSISVSVGYPGISQHTGPAGCTKMSRHVRHLIEYNIIQRVNLPELFLKKSFIYGIILPFKSRDYHIGDIIFFKQLHIFQWGLIH